MVAANWNTVRELSKMLRSQVGDSLHIFPWNALTRGMISVKARGSLIRPKSIFSVLIKVLIVVTNVAPVSQDIEACVPWRHVIHTQEHSNTLIGSLLNTMFVSAFLTIRIGIIATTISKIMSHFPLIFENDTYMSTIFT